MVMEFSSLLKSNRKPLVVAWTVGQSDTPSPAKSCTKYQSEFGHPPRCNIKTWKKSQQTCQTKIRSRTLSRGELLLLGCFFFFDFLNLSFDSDHFSIQCLGDFI